MRLLLIISLIIFSFETVFAQMISQSDNMLLLNNKVNNLKSFGVAIPKFNPLKNDINYPTLVGLGSLAVGGFVAAHVYQAKAWWKPTPNKSLKIGWDPNYALYFDKEGHFLAGYFLCRSFSSLFEASNFQPEDARIYSSIISFGYELYIEIQDGTSKGMTFAPDDLIAATIGSTYSLAQYYFPILNNFQPRISYYPSETIVRGSKEHNVFDDYAGQKHWVAIRIKELLPKKFANYWPSFLMISIGTGLKNYFTNKPIERELFLALDFDPTVLPLFGKFWEFIKNSLSYIHFPLPGIKIYPEQKLYLILY